VPAYLLDTDTLIGLLHPERRLRILPRLLAQPPGAALTSAIVAHELYFGAAKSARPEENRRSFDRLFTDLMPLGFERGDAEAAGEIGARLRAQGMPIGPYDVLVAGQALARRLTLVTGNTREFARVDGLSVANWLDEGSP
jgi:tRNA(fMet)-specific endonuclease VapC